MTAEGTSSTRPPGLTRLVLAGASAFWLVNVLISLTPMAARYRSDLSISYVPMLVEAAIGGLLIAAVVGWLVLRVPQRIPGRTPMAKSVLLSLAVLIVSTVLLEVPAKFLGAVDDPWRQFVIALVFNALRILALGLVIGRLATPSAPAAGPPTPGMTTFGTPRPPSPGLDA